jgi:hypothetical protein
MSKLFVFLGLAASIVLFISALLLLGSLPPIGERLVGGQYSFLRLVLWTDISSSDPGLLFVLSMVRHSTLPGRMNQGINDLSTLEEDELRRFGETIQVHFSSQDRQLEVTGCKPKVPAVPWPAGRRPAPASSRVASMLIT